MKTTLDLPDQLLRQAKIRAIEEGLTLKDLVVDALQLRLAPQAPPPTPRPPSAEGLDDDDPFFAALQQVRDWGNSQMPGSRKSP